MTNFYLAAAGLVLFAGVFVVFPILGAILANKQKQRRQLSNANVIKQRISELERELEEGLINPEDKESTIKELKLALVDETPLETQLQVEKSNAADTDSIVTQGYRQKLIYVLLAVPCIALGVWVYSQSNQLLGLQEYKQAQIDVEEIRARMQSSGAQSLTPDDYAKLALSIRRKLRDTPQDDNGWAFLGQINVAIGRMEEGIAAFKKALDINPQNHDVRFKFAEALMLSQDEQSLENAKRQLVYLIGQKPSERNYRLLLTATAIQLQDAELALANFNIIKDEINPESQFYQSLVAGLQNLGVNVMPANTNSIPDDLQTDTKETQIVIQVSVADELKSKLPQQGYLIVFAQNAESESRAPLAVKRMPLSKLPVTVSLSDSDAMIPAMNLSSAKLINVSARISLDADVMPKAGEFEGSVMQVTLTPSHLAQGNPVQGNEQSGQGTQNINLLIDKEIQ
ncbi:c-type cytochrome biogenesis protein CcmI [Glaciecola petra]|uniref:C-type cytochrome biogenesis protein CcmI n=1 Tax=Glaciecola petra TaxID=3075602 RepID=A0ABU2ZNM1_9ALTE|nr:c-type cytochrome biogenesis protein CcmI [Aestuariibacter sp. P117]MDT0593648.1 c-type cytochrome biogenesis protein CcmI [Aestuariibacter sp. P117]